ncbi:MAG: mandelate racemase/muconate lactonizing enzyme family protein [Hyphomicrobiales bacterium]|nr:mandelate racemase/muconate lactonizing enzyme family protein [Hyphomicrobiales bacterium]
MKITAVRTFIVPAQVTGDAWCRGKAWVLVKVETDGGISGWGEAYALHDRERSTAALVHELARYVDGMEPFRIKYFTTMAYEHFSEFQGGIDFFAAVSGIEIALWDIVGKALGVPVNKLLGGPCRDRVSVYANCWSHRARSAEELASYATAQVELGFRAVKIYPFCYSDDVDEGITRLVAVREALGSNIDILVDAWRVADIASIGKVSDALRRCGVEWFEDPIAPDNTELLAEIRQIARLPIVTGESFCTKREFRPLLEQRSVDILNPDITCCGILEIKEIAAMAEPYCASVAIHNYNTMAIGLAASLQVASVIPNFARIEFFNRFVEPSKLFSSHSYAVGDDGCIALGNEPGLGVSIDETVLRSFKFEPGLIRKWPQEILKALDFNRG